MTPEETWDQLVASALQKASTGAAPKQLGLSRLQPRTELEKDKAVRPEIRRTVALIDPELRRDIRACVAGESPWPLFVTGPAGAGKTCAGLCLIDFAWGEYHTAASLCAKLIQSQQGRLEWHHIGQGGTIWPEKFWQGLRFSPLVVLDEIGGRERVSDFHYEAVKTLLDERSDRPLMVMSNLGLEQIDALYDDRISSRLAAGTVLKLEAEDRRVRRVS